MNSDQIGQGGRHVLSESAVTVDYRISACTLEHMSRHESGTPVSAHSDAPSVDYTNSGHRLRRLFTPLSVGSGRKFYDRFQAAICPGTDDRILDVGVTSDTSTEDSNYLEQWGTVETLNVLDERSLRASFPIGVTPVIVPVRTLGLRSHLIAYGESRP